jgi:hypothetical protein
MNHFAVPYPIKTEVADSSEPIKIHKIDEDMQYVIFDVPYIRNNQDNIVEHCHYSAKRIKDCIAALKQKKLSEITGQDITWYYSIYNIFSIASGSEHFWNIYKDLVQCSNQYFEIMKLDMPRQLWAESWLNIHDSKEVLKKHDHTFDYHGYVSIDPQYTETVFLDYKDDKKVLYRLENKPGRIYIGPGRRPHFVANTKMYLNKRITLGFDLLVNRTETYNLGFIPVPMKNRYGV